ncbi:SDR family oxidoreductase [Salipaludibacillus neizhouensis]|nr:SDR family oxidoreductase [Salipaludibacillus neizhouensis]
MKVFVTGVTGFVGGEFTKKLLQEGHEVISVVRNIEKAEAQFSKSSTITFLTGDLHEPSFGLSNKKLHDLMNGPIDAMYHIAGQVQFGLEYSEYLKTNYSGTKNALDLAKLLEIKNFKYVSTAFTLGLSNSIGKEELYSKETNFNNAYEKSKCMAEHLVMSYSTYFSVSIYRPSVIIGDSKTGEANSDFTLNSFIKIIRLIKKLSESKNESFRFIAPRSSTVNVVPVDYVVAVLFAGLEDDENQTIYHITNSHPPSYRKSIRLITDMLNFDQFTIVNDLKIESMNQSETLFYDKISTLKNYLVRQLTFHNENTIKLLSCSNLKELDVSDEILSTIIHARIPTKLTTEKV